ncbi:hypothetical protein [Streptomyces sp. bgisy100]|uniref:hypothetical protein n=1 Tax=Streptomyces sp. bgisy100 TaxID=3413783 RepID=UPI003D7162C8
MQLPGWRGGDGNAAYLDKTLRHGDMELSLAEGVSGRFILFLVLRAFFASVLVAMVPAFIGLISLMADLGGSSEYGGYGSSSSDGGAAGAAWLMFAFIASTAAFWLVLLASRVREPLGAWRVLLADREDRATSVYSQIRGTLRLRRSPLAVQERRIRTGGRGAESISHRLVLDDGPYTAYVSVFGYGSSLYLGWTMWRSRRGAALFAQFVGDLFRGVLGQNTPEKQMMRADRPQAMREAVHLACREGLFVAIEGIDVPDSYGFPQGLPPVVDEDVPAAPAPAPVPVPPMPPRPGVPPQAGGPGTV